jgi:hypothetical protein
MVEQLPSKHKALSSNFSTEEKKGQHDTGLGLDTWMSCAAVYWIKNNGKVEGFIKRMEKLEYKYTMLDMSSLRCPLGISVSLGRLHYKEVYLAHSAGGSRA